MTTATAAASTAAEIATETETTTATAAVTVTATALEAETPTAVAAPAAAAIPIPAAVMGVATATATVPAVGTAVELTSATEEATAMEGANMNSVKTWREKARVIIKRVITEVGREDAKALRKALREAYPFGPREYYPYKVWLDEIKVQMGDSCGKRRLENQGQGRLFDE